MTDIVERLRREGVEFHEQLEAADEIERLRGNIEDLRALVSELRDIQIERLRAALQEIASDICSRSGQVDIARRALEPKP